MSVPNAAELLAAVRQFVETDVQRELKGRSQFHARVAANVLRILERELALRPSETERQAFNAYFGEALPPRAAQNRLAGAIRAGTLTESSPGLLDLLQTITLARLAADNPAYSTYRRLVESDIAAQNEL